MARSAASEMQDPQPIEVDAPAESAATAAPSGSAIVAHESMIAQMRRKFANEKRVRVKVHNDGPVPVQVNGYTFVIRENVWVEVPESVAAILDDAGYI